MYQETPEEYSINNQEFLNRRRYSDSPGYTNTTPRPHTSPVNSRQIINGIPAASGRINRSLHINDCRNVYNHYERLPHPAFQSTPINQNVPYFTCQEYDPEMDPNLSSIPDYSRNLMIGQGEPRSHHSAYNESHHQESAIKSSSTQKSSRHESIIEWYYRFDRTVEAELQKRRKGSLSVGENVNISPSFHPNKSFKSNPVLYEASTAAIDIEGKLQPGPDTELLDAVDKLAKAEAMIAFEGAIKAAEEAAANAPPELAEEAAAAGAKGFQAELTGLVKQEIPGIKPIEVIGYVGITRPKKPRKPNFVT